MATFQPFFFDKNHHIRKKCNGKNDVAHSNNYIHLTPVFKSNAI